MGGVAGNVGIASGVLAITGTGASETRRADRVGGGVAATAAGATARCCVFVSSWLYGTATCWKRLGPWKVENEDPPLPALIPCRHLVGGVVGGVVGGGGTRL